ncbi:hypothetical protein IVB15_09125 [Bradyrhizobium sp. 182]|nr:MULTISPECIES: hypothetical protein [unclassified Bradyrhizobium]MCK1422392.1 hypothetical protein [Bradyrhizobium sp. CW12]MCK1527905.1 hypothetical protein [Bradyrhizobium sp. 182]MCK1649062.1 hypothetical protein [Bradyrhizobium sp. 154]
MRRHSETDDITYANRIALVVRYTSYNCEPGDFSLTQLSVFFPQLLLS